LSTLKKLEIVVELHFLNGTSKIGASNPKS
jgi:hypothetical protein